MYILCVILPLVITDAILFKSVFDAERRNQTYYREKGIDAYNNYLDDLLSSDATIATVNDGVVTAIQAGTATITAQATDGSNQQATAIVTIYPDEDAINVPFADQKDAIIHTLSGTRLDRITKTGVYIINGQKRLVKVKR